jgi:flagellar hook protein FlgE
MSLFSALHTGSSGLGVSSTYLSVIGDNIANINTTGYKQTRASFADFLPQDVFGLSGGGQVGTGAATNVVSTLFGQGTLQDTDSATDLAISGNGFFVVSSGDQDYYTRNGTFGVDESGYLVAPGGMRVQGYGVDGGALSSVVGDIQIDASNVAGTATSTVVVDAMLSADVDETALDLTTIDFYGTGTGVNTIAEGAANSDFTTSVTVYDSEGVGHEVTLMFDRTSSTDWTWRAVTDASEVYDSTSTPYATEEGFGFELATGSVTFDTSGNLTGFTQTDTTGFSFLNAGATAISFDFGLDATGNATDGALTTGGDTESTLTSISQDGSAPGSLSSLAVSDDGTVMGTYTNGEEAVLGQVVLATFDSNAGLERVGGTLFAATSAAGDPSVGVAGTGSRGTISGYALEGSNVELEDQFVAMITAQRTYQANSKVISTVNETLSGLLQIL